MIGFNFTYMRYNVQFALVLAMVTGPGKGWATGCFFFNRSEHLHNESGKFQSKPCSIAVQLEVPTK